MPISGYVAGGASEALEEVLDRRLKEQIRQQQEKQHADNIAVERERINLQARRDEAMDLERQEDRKARQQTVDIAAAQRAEADTGYGVQTPETAAVMMKDPALAARFSQRPIINARPIGAQSVLPGAAAPEGAGDVGGPTLQTDMKPMLRTIDASPIAAAPTALGGTVTPGIDKSGPQSLPVLAPTPVQAKAAELAETSRTYHDALAGKPQSERQRLATEAAGRGVKIDSSLVEATEEEKQKTRDKEKKEEREFQDDRWLRQQNWSLSHQKEHPQVWVSKAGENDRFVTPSQAATLSQQGWKHATTAADSTEDERKSVGFYRQMSQAMETMDELEDKVTDKELLMIQSLPQEQLVGLMVRGEMSETAKRYMRAFEQFTEARIRPVSGAAIADSEFARDRRTYGKQFHETPQLNKDRRAARDVQLDTLRLRSGRAFKDTVVRPPGGKQPIYFDAKMPDGSTKRLQSTDGGATWQPAK